MDLIGTKVLVAVLFFLIRFFFGILPRKIHSVLRCWDGEEEGAAFINQRRHDQVTCFLAVCQSFGGGVLFATCFLHMIPEVHESLLAFKEYADFNTEYPLPEFMVCCGFFIIYFVEEFSHWFITKIPDEPIQQGCTRTPPNKVTPEPDPRPYIIDPKAHEIKSPTNSEKKKMALIEDVTADDNPILEEYDDDILDNLSINSSKIRENMTEKKNQTNKEQELELKAKTEQQYVRYVLIVLALSLHAVFEGLSIGLQTTKGNIWYLFIAVSIHSITILFYIGLELLLNKTSFKIMLTHILFLSITSPLGVLLGLAITVNSDMNSKAKSAAVVFLEGFSAGTILYITFFEVLNREKKRRIYRLRRGFFILLGFALMAGLQCIEINK